MSPWWSFYEILAGLRFDLNILPASPYSLFCYPVGVMPCVCTDLSQLSEALMSFLKISHKVISFEFGLPFFFLSGLCNLNCLETERFLNRVLLMKDP